MLWFITAPIVSTGYDNEAQLVLIGPFILHANANTSKFDVTKFQGEHSHKQKCILLSQIRCSIMVLASHFASHLPYVKYELAFTEVTKVYCRMRLDKYFDGFEIVFG